MALDAFSMQLGNVSNYSLVNDMITKKDSEVQLFVYVIVYKRIFSGNLIKK